MEEEKHPPADHLHHHHHHSVQYCSARIMSPEIVEIGEDHSRSIGAASRDAAASDVYVAVGKDDLHVLKWALDHAVSPGARIYLVHVFSPVTYINTPGYAIEWQSYQASDIDTACVCVKQHKATVGRLARSQLNQEQVTVETMLVESKATAKAILDLISVANVTSLVMGTKLSPPSRLFTKKLSKGEFVKKNAPDYCEVTIVHDGKKVVDGQKVAEAELARSSSPSPSSPGTGRPQVKGKSRRNLFECVCLSGKFQN
ncbi:Usp domain-containing protein [Citrus sinensis]|uniref:Usp domain-containing protein n=1 Tax=Citrus sinensis TaxID=2711 RepID=A0ACB8LSN4_CITSI|nr:Usp domain-containing protein [Citrus sinensis]